MVWQSNGRSPGRDTTHLTFRDARFAIMRLHGRNSIADARPAPAARAGAFARFAIPVVGVGFCWDKVSSSDCGAPAHWSGAGHLLDCLSVVLTMNPCSAFFAKMFVLSLRFEEIAFEFFFRIRSNAVSCTIWVG